MKFTARVCTTVGRSRARCSGHAHAAVSPLLPSPKLHPAESTAAPGPPRVPSPVGAQQACTKSRARAGHRAEQHASTAAASPRQGPAVWIERVSGSALPAARFS